jgi:hypothetical protein
MTISMAKAAVTTTGTTGAAAGTALMTPHFNGTLYAVYLDYASVTPVTNVEIRLGDPAVAIFTKNDNATDGWWFPRWKPRSNTGAGWTVEATADGQQPPVYGQLTLSVSSSTPATDAVTAYAFIQDAELA